jgi:hypothetical protein
MTSFYAVASGIQRKHEVDLGLQGHSGDNRCYVRYKWQVRISNRSQVGSKCSL